MENLNEWDEINRELDMFEAEKEWQRTLPKHTDIGWLQIFPEMKKAYGGFFGKTTRLKLRIEKMKLKVEYNAVDEALTHWLKINAKIEQWTKDMRVENGREELRLIQKKMSAVDWQLKSLSNIGKDPEKIKAQEKTIQITEAMIDKARAFPVEQLVEVNRQGFTKCFAHNDSKPSAYCRKNFIHCFVCSKSWDTIAVLMERDSLTFRQAILQLQ